MYFISQVNDCQGGQGSPRAVAPRGRKELVKLQGVNKSYFKRDS